MDIQITLQSLFVVLLFSFLYFYSKSQQTTKKPTSHGLKSYPIIGHLPHLIRNSHRFLDWITEILLETPTHTVGICSIGANHSIFTANQANVEHLLKLNSMNYPKGERVILMLKELFGHGILNSEGEEWKRQRKLASFDFSQRSLRNFVVETVDFEIIHRLLPILNKAAENGVKVELQDVLQRFAFDNICKVVLGEDPACLTEEEIASDRTSSSKEFMAAFSDAQDFSNDRFLDLIEDTWKIKKFLNIGSENRLKKASSTLNARIMNIIRSRMVKGIDLNGRDDMLSRFASIKEYNEIVLRDILTNFLHAGRETTSTALTWFFWLVSTRPDVNKKILGEIKLVRSSNRITTETFSFDALKDLNYLHAAITESMRLYPPLPMDSVTCKEDDVMPDGTFVGKGWFVTYSAYIMGRSEDIWGKDCLDFKPERWLDENGIFKPESPFRYTVFHAGPRICIGKEMAYIQMKSIVVSVLERFELKALGKEGTAENTNSIFLRMKGGLPVLLKIREN